LQESVRLQAVSYFFPAFLHGKLFGRKNATIFTKAGLHVFVCGLIEKLVWRKEILSAHFSRMPTGQTAAGITSGRPAIRQESRVHCVRNVGDDLVCHASVGRLTFNPRIAQ
jgi:hypothetical protein